MGYSSKDLENFGRELNAKREEKARKQGEELANNLIDNTSKGRGLWFIILWPTWIFITLSIGVFSSMLLEQKFSIEQPISFLGFLVGFMVASSWYDWDFTRRHPFFSSIFGFLGFGIAILFLAEKFGMN